MTELTEAQKIIMRAEVNEYERKQKAWSIDRAIEIMRCPSYKGAASAAEVALEADVLVAYLSKTPKHFPIPNADEAEKAVEQMKATGEI